MFNWFNNKKSVNNEMSDTVITSSEAQVKRRLINQIQALSGVTQNDFKALYIMSIERFADYLSIPNQAESLTTLIDVLKQVILALKKRQGYLLPLGSDSETSFREREEWTYAIFTGGLLSGVEVSHRFDVAKAILPKQSFAWLHRNETLFFLWQDYLQGQRNILSDIIHVEEIPQDRATSVANNPVIQAPENAYKAKPISVEPPASIKKSELPEGAVIQEVDLSVLASNTEEKNQAPPWKDQVGTEQAVQPIEAIVKLPKFTAKEFWQWLRESLENQHVSLNEADSMVHRVDLGLLLVIPQVVDSFIHEKAKQLGIDSETAGLSQRIDLTKAIKKHESLVRNAQGSRIHAYCIGQWQDRQVLSGLVVKSEVILSHSAKVPINPLLTIDPMAAS